MDMTPPPLPPEAAATRKKVVQPPGIKRVRLGYQDQRQVENVLRDWIEQGRPLEHAEAMAAHLAQFVTLEKGKQLGGSHVETIAKTLNITLPGKPRNPVRARMGDLNQAQQRIAELEQQLALAQAQPPESVEALADALQQRDEAQQALTQAQERMGELRRDLDEAQARIAEITKLNNDKFILLGRLARAAENGLFVTRDGVVTSSFIETGVKSDE